MPVIPAFGRQDNLFKFKANLVYIESCRIARALCVCMYVRKRYERDRDRRRERERRKMQPCYRRRP